MQEFEDFIIKCCALDEWDLREWLRSELADAGFAVQEDDYRGYRGGKYDDVHNLLAIRGDAAVCLVAHTDVCRDHGRGKEHKKAVPVIKVMERAGEKVRIIQDEHCQVQVGGDDRLGVAINTWTALCSDYEMGLLYTSDEEVGNQSAEQVRFPEMTDFKLCVQVDRGNHSNQLVTNIGGTQLCDQEMSRRLLDLAWNLGMPREPVRGLMTDVLALTENRMIKSAVNMTCGYHSSFGAGANEYIVIDEAANTQRYVAEIIRSFQSDAVINEPDNQEMIML